MKCKRGPKLTGWPPAPPSKTKVPLPPVIVPTGNEKQKPLFSRVSQSNPFTPFGPSILGNMCVPEVARLGREREIQGKGERGASESWVPILASPRTRVTSGPLAPQQ